MVFGLIAILSATIVATYERGKLGGYEEFHRPSADESTIYNEALQNLKKGLVNKSLRNPHHLDLLDGAENIKVKKQVVSGLNFFFEIITGNEATPCLYMKVFQDLNPKSPLLVEYIGTEKIY